MLRRVGLVYNQPSLYSFTVHVPDGQPYSQPYWLEKPKDGWLYTVPDPRMIGDPENPPVLEAHFRVKIAGTEIEFDGRCKHRYIDHVYGERTRPLAIVPPVGIDLTRTALVFPDTNPRRVEVRRVRSRTSRKPSGDVRLDAPDGWHVEPASRHFDLAASDEQTTAVFDVTPPSSDAQARVARDRHRWAIGRSRSKHRADFVSAHSRADAVSACGNETGARRYPDAGARTSAM